MGRFEPVGWWLAAAWLAGTALQLQQPELWRPAAYQALLAGAVLALLAGLRWRRFAVCAVAAAATLAFAAAGWRAADRQSDALPAVLEGEDLVVTGVVAQMPRVGPDGVRFLFDVESASHRGAPAAVPRRISLGWYRGFDADAWIAGPVAEVRAGQRWRLTVRLKQPHGSMNPHGFDVELWLFEQGIRAGGSVRASAGAGSAAAALKLADNVAHPVERARQRVRDAIDASVADRTAAGVLAALAIGDQGAIERSDWDLFRATGVAHLMSISGLHVTMFAWLAGGAVGWCWRRSSRLPLWLPAPRAARFGGLAAAAGYAVLAGWGVPAQRTVWMIAVVVLLKSRGLRWPLLAVLLAAAVVVTALDPWALLQPGFWLSFVAVAMLASAEPVAPAAQPAAVGWRSRLRSAVSGGLRSQLIATVALAPLSMVFFQQVSLVGFAANIVAIPLVTLLVTPLALLGVLLAPLWLLAGAIVHGLIGYLSLLASWPLAVWTAAVAPAWALLPALLGGVLLVLPLPWRLRALGLPLLLPLLLPPVQRPPAGRFEAVALDIGQGTSVLVRTERHLLVFDTGPQYSADADAGQRVLLPLLRARGERQLDLLMLSHRDADHVGGAASLLAGMPVARIDSSLPEDHRLLNRGVPHRRCEAGQSWVWDGVRFDVLHPTAAEHAVATKPNAVSCVLRIAADTPVGGDAAATGDGPPLPPQPSLLLTGDIEAAQEAALLARAAQHGGVGGLHADVLQAPHHGSRTSSSAAFIDAVAPRTAVFQAAYRSRFHHPAPDVVARYVARGVDPVTSSSCGAWTLPADGSAPWCQRQRALRYWHHRPPPDLP